MADASPVVVVVVEGAPPGGGPMTELHGGQRLAELHGLLVERARAWAVEAFGAGLVTVAPAGGGGDGRDDDGDGDGDGGLAVAAREALAAAPGRPVIVVAPVLPVWRPAIAAAVLDDLRDGCAAVVGPVFDGGCYLLAFARAVDALLDLSAGDWTGHDALGAVLGAAQAAGLEIGMLRTERGLRRPADVRALLADPLTDGELRELLG